MKIKKLTALLNVADLAIQHQQAKNKERSAKDDYHLAWRRFELCGEDPEDHDCNSYRITRADSDLWDGAIAATKSEYAAYKAAKQAAYNAGRRLENAVRKMK